MSARLQPRIRVTVPGQRLPERRFQTWPMRLSHRGNRALVGYSRSGRYPAWRTFRDVFGYAQADRDVAAMLAKVTP